MKFIETFAVECCKFKNEYAHKYEAISALLRHIRRNHKDVFLKIDRAGRREAKSQNGRGYIDYNKPKGDGWHKAQASFREAWREMALERMLRK